MEQEGRKRKAETNEVKFVGLVCVCVITPWEVWDVKFPARIELMPSAAEAQSLNLWTTMEDPSLQFLIQQL